MLSTAEKEAAEDNNKKNPTANKQALNGLRHRLNTDVTEYLFNGHSEDPQDLAEEAFKAAMNSGPETEEYFPAVVAVVGLYNLNYLRTVNPTEVEKTLGALAVLEEYIEFEALFEMEDAERSVVSIAA